MWASMVVIFLILSENVAEVVFIQNQDMIETLFTNRAYPPFCKSIFSGSSVRGMQEFNPFGRKHIII
jgi:hypothetical protein